MWLLFGLLNSGFLAVRRLYDKRALDDYGVPPLTLSWSTRAIALIGLAVLTWVAQKPDLSSLPDVFWLAVFFTTVVFYPIFSWFYYTSVRDGKISTTLPILGLIPVLSLVWGYLFRGEIPSLLGLLGVLAVAFSLYFMHFHHFKHPLEPLKELVSEKPARQMLLVAVVASFSAVVDKVGVEAGGAVVYASFNLLGAVAGVSLIDWLMHRNQPLKPLFKNWHMVLWIGIIELLVFLFYNLALSGTPSVAYVVALRDISIILTAAAGSIMFKEKISKHTVAAYNIALIGALLLAFH